MVTHSLLWLAGFGVPTVLQPAPFRVPLCKRCVHHGHSLHPLEVNLVASEVREAGSTAPVERETSVGGLSATSNRPVSPHRCDSTEKLKALLPRLEQELKDSTKFKDFYQFTFSFAKNPGQKGLGEYESPCAQA